MEDLEILSYLRKVLYTLCAVLVWIFIVLTAGIYLGLAFQKNYSQIVTLFFYAGSVISLLFLLRYLLRLWRK